MMCLPLLNILANAAASEGFSATIRAVFISKTTWICREKQLNVNKYNEHEVRSRQKKKGWYVIRTSLYLAVKQLCVDNSISIMRIEFIQCAKFKIYVAKELK